MAHSIRTLFACWLTVVATGTDVAHCHAGGVGHTHGYGWVSVDALPSGNISLAHHHYIFCGIEFGAMEGPPGEQPDGTHPALTSDSFDAHDCSANGESAPHLDSWFILPDSGLFEEGPFAGASELTPPARPLTSHARSCVLRL